MNKYRYEKTKALTFASIMSAISIVFVLITYFTGDIGLILTLLLPLCASLVSVNVNYKYSLIYVISTLLISLIDFQLALFVILPSLISGFLFGKLIKVYIQGHYIILFNALLLSIMQIGSTYLINAIYQIDLIKVMATLIKVNEVTFSNAYLLFLFIISLIQCSLSYLIITSELKKLDYEFNEKKNHFILNLYLNVFSICLTILMMFISHYIGFLLLGISIYLGIILAYYNFSFYLTKRILYLQIPLYVISFILIFVLISYIPLEYQVYLFLLPIISQLITSLYIVIYQKIIKKSKINSSIFDKLQ